MSISPEKALEECETLMLDMDGTLLDLAYDNYMWREHIPEAYARKNDMTHDAARDKLYAHFRSMQGQLKWYCLDHWSELLDLDIIELHRNEHQKIGYLDGARVFLQTVADDGMRVLMVTNSHQGTLDIKSEVTGIDQFFDRLYTAHDFGYAKEDQSFWHALQEAESFDPETTLFVDDTLRVLESARKFGIKSLLSVTCPDSRRPAKSSDDFSGVERVADMLRPAD
jgi:HAD superfamily hydrolase (TIGR01509 family)